MVTVFVLLMMTAGLTYGLETQCDARQNGTQCYGAVNGTVYLQLVEKIDPEHDYQWSKVRKNEKNKTDIVFKFRKFRTTRKFLPTDTYKHRTVFNGSSGTLKMSYITRSDEAQYFLEVSNSLTGFRLQTKDLHLSVQAPVSSPTLSSECLSQGQMSVSCSCEGDSVQYSWALDGEPLTDKHLFSGYLDTQNITLTQGLSGLLGCDVNNSVSKFADVVDIKPCPGFKFVNCTLSNGTHIPPQWVSDNDTLCATTPTPTPVTPAATTTTTTPMTASERPSGKETDNITSTSSYTCFNQSTCLTNREDPQVFRYIPHIAGSLAALLLLVIGLGIYCSQKKKKNKYTGADAEDEDVTYADVRLVQNADTRVRRAERQVEYGEVKGSKVRGSGRQHNADSTEADCIYAKVRV